MKVFLLFLVIIGMWNLINFIARVVYKEIDYKYSYHIIVGLWALFILIFGK